MQPISGKPALRQVAGTAPIKRTLVVFGIAALGAWLAVCFSFAIAEVYPDKPIRLVIPAAPGGSTDLLARLVGARLTEIFKVQIIVDNRATASGVMAGEIVAKAPPDGYTLLLVYHQHTVNAALNPKLPYHPVNDFTPITQITAAGLVLVVNPTAPPKTLREFVDWTKSYKGALNFGSAGIGSGGHLAGELYKIMTGVKAEHIPYKGSGPALIDLMGNQFQFTFTGMQTAQPFVRSGKLRAIAVTTSDRVKTMPDTPAVAEVLPGFEVVGWFGFMAPAGLPAPILERLHAEIVNVLKEPAVHDRIVSDGSEPVGNTPEAFRKFLVADMAKWAKVVKQSGATLQ